MPEAGLEDHPSMITLVCKGSKQLPVCAQDLLEAAAAASEALVEMVELCKDGQLLLGDDSDRAWHTALAIHTGAEGALDWGNVKDVIELADKWQLQGVLAACQQFIVSKAASLRLPSGTYIIGWEAFGARSNWCATRSDFHANGFCCRDVSMERGLQVLDLLHRAQLEQAYQTMLAHYMSEVVKLRDHSLGLQVVRNARDVAQEAIDTIRSSLRKHQTQGALCSSTVMFDISHYMMGVLQELAFHCYRLNRS